MLSILWWSCFQICQIPDTTPSTPSYLFLFFNVDTMIMVKYDGSGVRPPLFKSWLCLLTGSNLCVSFIPSFIHSFIQHTFIMPDPAPEFQDPSVHTWRIYVEEFMFYSQFLHWKMRILIASASSDCHEDEIT